MFRRKIILRRPEPVVGWNCVGVGITADRHAELSSASVTDFGVDVDDLTLENPLAALAIFKAEAIQQYVDLASAADASELTVGAETFRYSRNHPEGLEHLRATLNRTVAPLPLKDVVSVEYVVAPVFDVPLRPPANFSRHTFFVHPERTM